MPLAANDLEELICSSSNAKRRPVDTVPTKFGTIPSHVPRAC